LTVFSETLSLCQELSLTAIRAAITQPHRQLARSCLPQ
jgi:hypothetical protein